MTLSKSVNGLTPEEENRLVERILDDDQRAAEKIYEHYLGFVHAIVRKRIKNFSQVDEVVQIVMTKLFQRLKQFDPARGSLKSWVGTMTANSTIDYLRTKYLKVFIPTDPQDAVLFENIGHTMPEEDYSEELGIMTRAMVVLNSNERIPIVLSHYHGLTEQEIANELELPLGTVKGRIRRGMQKLRKEMSRMLSTSLLN